MASISEILLQQGRHAAETRRARGGTWTPLIQSLANLPAQVSADRQAERDQASAMRDADEARQVRGLQRQEVEGRLTDAASARTSEQQAAETRAALMDVLSQPDIVTDDGFDLPKAREYADRKGWGQLLSGALIEADRETDSAAVDSRTKQATLARIQRENTEGERAQSAAANQRGMRQMIGSSIAQRGGAPMTEADRQQLKGMALQEDVDLPSGLIPEDKPDTRSLQQQAADAFKRKDFDTYKSLLGVMRETAAAERAPQSAARQSLTPNMEANVVRQLASQWTTATGPARELERQVSIMDQGIQAARAGNLNAGGQAVLVTFQKILDPTSVVRESEFDRSREGISLMQRARGAYERMTRGGPGVPLPELEQFARLAREIATAQQSSRLAAIQERIGRVADRYTIPRELVFDAPPDTTTQPPQTAPGTTPSGGSAAPQEFDFNPTTGQLVPRGGR